MLLLIDHFSVVTMNCRIIHTATWLLREIERKKKKKMFAIGRLAFIWQLGSSRKDRTLFELTTCTTQRTLIFIFQCMIYRVDIVLATIPTLKRTI